MKKESVLILEKNLKLLSFEEMEIIAEEIKHHKFNQPNKKYNYLTRPEIMKCIKYAKFSKSVKELLNAKS